MLTFLALAGDLGGAVGIAPDTKTVSVHVDAYNSTP